MHPDRRRVDAVVNALRTQLGEAPDTALVLGSGLGGFTRHCTIHARYPSVELGLPRSTVAGHAGELLRVQLGATELVICSGRVHLYEGLSADEVVRGVRALAEWGVQRLLLTCSAGGIRADLHPGRLVCIRDHIRLQAASPLTGPVPWGDGPRFPDLTYAYHPDLRSSLAAAAEARAVDLAEGTYAAVDGPAYETPSEVRMLGALGADMVGMSTAPEVLAAVQAGVQVGAVALISNRAAGLSGGPLSHDEVTEVADRAAADLAAVVEGWLAD